jgi:hypothetical protein
VNDTTRHPNALSHEMIVNRALWSGLIGGSVLNAVLHMIGLWLLAIPFGLVALLCAVGLVARTVLAPKHR